MVSALEGHRLLTTFGYERRAQLDRALAGSLASCAGATNAVAFLAAGVFSANMTGNVALLGERLQERAWSAAAFFTAVLAAFIAGACACATVTGLGRRRGWRGVYPVCLLAEAVGVVMAATLVPLELGGVRVPALSISLALLMGWQNALATTLTGARVRATHLSGICTDLGIEIGSLWNNPPGHDGARGPDIDARRNRLILGGITIAAFCFGAACGCTGYHAWDVRALVIVAIVLLCIATWSLVSTSLRASLADQG